MKTLKILGPVLLVLALFVALAHYFGQPKENPPIGVNEANTTKNAPSLRKLDITIDWVPSAEYYGLYYAKQNGYYSDAGFDVQIIAGNGAPAVAAQIATGASLVGTTTSDNILRGIQKGAVFSKASALIPVNLASLVVSPSSKIRTIKDVKGKNVGVNVQSSVYPQLLYLLKLNNVSPDSFTEVPIGYGGQAEFKMGRVDAFCAWTSNHAVDLQLDGLEFGEFLFEKLGISNYALVLVFADSTVLKKAGLSQEDENKLIRATIKGYDNGAKDVQGAFNALQTAEPTLKKDKIIAAISKVSQLRALTPVKPSEVDSWLGDQVSEKTRVKAALLYE